MNNCNFSGRLPRDAELKEVGQYKVCNFSIASDVGYGENKKTLWIDCAIWGKQGESLVQYLSKGQQVFINGELSTREYDKDGMTKTSLTVRVNSLDFGSAPKNADGQTMTSSTTIADNNALDDEIPF